MSIKHFSKEEIIAVAKDIIKNDTFIGIPDADKLSPNASLRETLDFTSLDIAELLVALEEKYNVNMEWADTGNIDTLNDVYDAFITSIGKTRKSTTTLNTIQKQNRNAHMKYTKQDVVSTAKTIIARTQGLKPNQIADKAYFVSDLNFDSVDAVEFITKMEEHYNIVIESQDFDNFSRILTTNLDVICDKFCNYLNTKAQTNKTLLQKQK